MGTETFANTSNTATHTGIFGDIVPGMGTETNIFVITRKFLVEIWRYSPRNGDGNRPARLNNET